MGSATVQMVGNVATEVKVSLENAGRERASFRLISTERRQDGVGNWVDGDQFSVTVVCWAALAKGVAGSIGKGDPVTVTGRLIERRYEVDGETRYSTELKASTVGHDLTRGRSVFTRSGQSRDAAPPAPDAAEPDVIDQLLGVAS